MGKEFTTKNQQIIQLNQQHSISGNKDLQRLVFDKFPKYIKNTLENTGSGLNQYNMVLQNTSYKLDTNAFAQLLFSKLKENENFKVLYNSEVCELYYDSKSGLINAVKILGKRGDALQCDAVVMCTGA